MSDDSDRRPDRRRHARSAERGEMSLASSRAPVSNLSINGAFVSILYGLQDRDAFSFELALDGIDEPPVQGRAIVEWTDPGIGVGVSFDLSEEEEVRLGRSLEALGMPQQTPESTTEEYDKVRRSRRTLAVGPGAGGKDTRVWFTYLPPDENSE